jgi:hypothetical protein
LNASTRRQPPSWKLSRADWTGDEWFSSRIAFTGFGKCDELAGDGLPNVIGAVPDPQSDAGHLESDPEGAPRQFPAWAIRARAGES